MCNELLSDMLRCAFHIVLRELIRHNLFSKGYQYNFSR